MKSKVLFAKVPAWIVSFALLWSGNAAAQAATAAAFDDCPAFPSTLTGVLRWEAMPLPNGLFCRALLTEGGAEAFAMTISRESPFKPRRSDRAEQARLEGRELYWYRGELPNQPNVQIREILIPIAADRVVHVFMQANDAQTIAKYQEYVMSLPFPNYTE